jgi:hypothetical protein
MLRISHKDLTAEGIHLRVEGLLVGPWVAELRRCCQKSLTENRILTLDLIETSFADREGVALLRDLARHGTRLHCSAFLEELLKASPPEKQGLQAGRWPEDVGGNGT